MLGGGGEGHVGLLQQVGGEEGGDNRCTFEGWGGVAGEGIILKVFKSTLMTFWEFAREIVGKFGFVE